MKKQVLLFLLLGTAVQPSLAQIRLDSVGAVSIGEFAVETSFEAEFPILPTETSPLASSDHQGGISCEATLKVYTKADESCNPAIYARALKGSDNGKQMGAIFDATNREPKKTGSSYGVIGAAGNRGLGFNYGVWGLLKGTLNGAAIVGTINRPIPRMNGTYAGYFLGSVYTAGTLTAQTITTISDARFKSNVQPIHNSTLEKVSSLNPVQYQMQSAISIAFANSEVDATTAADIQSEESKIEEQTTHYGLLAQEVLQSIRQVV